MLAKRAFNLREGWTPRTTGCPSASSTEPLELASGRAAALDPERLRAMIDGYYDARGLDRTGVPDDRSLAAHAAALHARPADTDFQMAMVTECTGDHRARSI